MRLKNAHTTEIRAKTSREYKNNNNWVNKQLFIVQELCESRGGRPWAVRPNEPSGFRGRKELMNRASALVTTCP